MTKEKTKESVFDNLESLTKPRDLAWSNWKSWKNSKVGDKISGYIRDVFYRKGEGVYEGKDQRALTLEQENGELINVGIKRLSFVLDKTDTLRLGDPVTIELSELKSNGKGKEDTKIFSYYGKNLEENKGNKTVYQLDCEDLAKGGTKPPETEVEKEFNEAGDNKEDIPFD